MTWMKFRNKNNTREHSDSVVLIFNWHAKWSITTSFLIPYSATWLELVDLLTQIGVSRPDIIGSPNAQDGTWSEHWLPPHTILLPTSYSRNKMLVKTNLPTPWPIALKIVRILRFDNSSITDRWEGRYFDNTGAAKPSTRRNNAFHGIIEPFRR